MAVYGVLDVMVLLDLYIRFFVSLAMYDVCVLISVNCFLPAIILQVGSYRLNIGLSGHK